MELDSSELLKRFVGSQCRAWALCRARTSRKTCKPRHSPSLTIADAKIQRDLALVYRKEKAMSRAAQAFIEIAVKLKAAVTG